MQDLQRSVHTVRMKLAYAALVVLTLSFCRLSDAETYLNIGPLDSLADIKVRFPNAKLKEIHPAWASESELLIQVTGVGISGSIIIKFDDAIPDYRKLLADALSDEEKQSWQALIDKPDEAKTIAWLRWVPPDAIPLQRFILKYGPNPDKGFSDQDLQPFRSWPSGVTAFLTDDEKSVVRIDYYFTDDERRAAYLQKFGVVPTYLKPKPKPAGAVKRKKH
jgi:hypothetical protein